MKKYRVLIPCFKKSDKKNYNVGDIIEYTPEDAELMLIEKRIEEIESEEKPKEKKRNNQPAK